MGPACGDLFMVSGPTGFVFLGEQSLACLHPCKACFHSCSSKLVRCYLVSPSENVGVFQKQPLKENATLYSDFFFFPVVGNQ